VSMALEQLFPIKQLDQKECFCSTTPTLISTVLGSCVAITVFDPVKLAGGMSHAFLPTKTEYTKDHNSPCMFVDTSIDTLMSQMAKLGSRLSDLEIKLFGGGEVLGVGAAEPGQTLAPRLFSVGSRNVELARKVLKEYGLKLKAQDVGGQLGRKLLFLTNTGGAWVKRLRRIKR